MGYRITADYDDPDPINGGPHHSVDVGNFRQGDPVYAPGPCQAEGLRHFDGALGVRFYAPEGEVWELWHLDTVLIPTDEKTRVEAGEKVGTTGDTGLGTGAHTHIERERNGIRVNPEPYLLGMDYQWAVDDMPALRPVREQWDIPANTPFWPEGPEQGPRKVFTTPERRFSCAETEDGIWRLIEYNSEILWVKRVDIVPRSGTRNPATGYGSPQMGYTSTQVRAERTKAADAVLEGAKAAAKPYGAS